ncbi:VOC family protein [Geomonas subterranea]|uniref:VOC family protein n=1 Tax=Geomonas subterranea TaxID=2847989 RepID=A0ABX8LL55_9BACT|nr:MULTISPECIES: VOC family protein [Geomonas]QXE92763.1 VOC family protein [Geomonas subterranea]QXM09133.1 VOC family protein [Geomonas subterranea]
MTRPIPEGFHTVTAMFMFKECRKAIEFYKNAFGAVERYAMPGPDGQGIMHAELLVGDSIIMMGDEFPGENCKSAETLGASPVSFYLYVENVDAAFRRALEAGAVEKMEVQEMFWGDRAGSLQDPFGYNWMLATHTRDLSPEEISDGAKAAFAQMPKEIKS